MSAKRPLHFNPLKNLSILLHSPYKRSSVTIRKAEESELEVLIISICEFQVREGAQEVLLKLMVPASSPQVNETSILQCNSAFCHDV